MSLFDFNLPNATASLNPSRDTLDTEGAEGDELAGASLGSAREIMPQPPVVLPFSSYDAAAHVEGSTNSTNNEINTSNTNNASDPINPNDPINGISTSNASNANNVFGTDTTNPSRNKPGTNVNTTHSDHTSPTTRQYFATQPPQASTVAQTPSHPSPSAASPPLPTPLPLSSPPGTSAGMTGRDPSEAPGRSPPLPLSLLSSLPAAPSAPHPLEPAAHVASVSPHDPTGGMFPPPNTLRSKEHVTASSVADTVGCGTLELTSTLAPFVMKLYRLVSDPGTDAMVHWSSEHDGRAFVVVDPVTFSIRVLPCYFNHSNFCSFVRQLHIYGFHKVESSMGYAFANENFRMGNVSLLCKITRHKGGKAGKVRKDVPAKQAEGQVTIDALRVCEQPAPTHSVGDASVPVSTPRYVDAQPCKYVPLPYQPQLQPQLQPQQRPPFHPIQAHQYCQQAPSQQQLSPRQASSAPSPPSLSAPSQQLQQLHEQQQQQQQQAQQLQLQSQPTQTQAQTSFQHQSPQQTVQPCPSYPPTNDAECSAPPCDQAYSMPLSMGTSSLGAMVSSSPSTGASFVPPVPSQFDAPLSSSPTALSPSSTRPPTAPTLAQEVPGALSPAALHMEPVHTPESEAAATPAPAPVCAVPPPTSVPPPASPPPSASKANILLTLAVNKEQDKNAVYKCLLDETEALKVENMKTQQRIVRLRNTLARSREMEQRLIACLEMLAGQLAERGIDPTLVLTALRPPVTTQGGANVTPATRNTADSCMWGAPAPAPATSAALPPGFTPGLSSGLSPSHTPGFPLRSVSATPALSTGAPFGPVLSTFSPPPQRTDTPNQGYTCGYTCDRGSSGGGKSIAKEPSVCGTVVGYEDFGMDTEWPTEQPRRDVARDISRGTQAHTDAEYFIAAPVNDSTSIPLAELESAQQQQMQMQQQQQQQQGHSTLSPAQQQQGLGGALIDGPAPSSPYTGYDWLKPDSDGEYGCGTQGILADTPAASRAPFNVGDGDGYRTECAPNAHATLFSDGFLDTSADGEGVEGSDPITLSWQFIE